MRSIFTLLLLLFLGGNAFAQFNNNNRNRNRNVNQRTPSLSVGLDFADPQNQFASAFDGTPVGVGVQFLDNIGRSPFEAGVGFSWLSRGSISEEVWIYEGNDVDGDDIYIRGDMDVNSNIYTYTGIGRVKPFNGIVQPYGDVIAGVRHFSTVTIIEPEEGDADPIRDRQHGDFTYTYGWAAGLKIQVNQSLMVEGRFSNMYGGAIDFVDRESIEIGDEGQLSFDNISSKTDLYQFQLGVSFNF